MLPPPRSALLGALALAACMGLAACRGKPEPAEPRKGARIRGMVEVPEGAFTFGSDDGDPDESPARGIELATYFIDVHEVTSEEYAAFCEATKTAPPVHWRGAWPPRGQERHPVTQVSYDEAQAYARWVGKALPTEQQCEKAARVADGRPFPWGARMGEGLCNAYASARQGTTAEVGSYPKGASPYGLQDMAGNVWEWTASPYDDSGEMVIRGGSFDYRESAPRASKRGRAAPGERRPTLGFRCAKSLVRPAPGPEAPAGGR
ncbi:MAG: formylglycine-generating enzyme family protein [Planctomycetes bacterium]|nr:formylglycine-generating enzyme family protein [Planctomycetota bacterium]